MSNSKNTKNPPDPAVEPVDSNAYRDDPNYTLPSMRPRGADTLTGRRPYQGLGEPQPLQHSQMVNAANQMLEMLKVDPEKVDDKAVRLMSLQAMLRYGGELGNVINKFEELADRVDRMSRVMEQYDRKPRATSETRQNRLRMRNGARRRVATRRPTES